MASLRNAIPQRPYRERAQPGPRGKLGILEKHKDYAKRAKDYNEKKARLRLLRQKATDRNPDEFHFGMMSSNTKGGVKVGDRGNKALSDAVVKLMKTQDAGYLRTIRERVRRERLKLEEIVQIVDVDDGVQMQPIRRTGGQPTHTVFVEDTEAQEKFDAAEWFDTNENGLARPYNRPRRRSEPDVVESPAFKKLSPRQQEAERNAIKESEKHLKKAKRDREYRTTRMEALLLQEKELLTAEEELDRQRGQMAHTVGGVNKHGVRFKVRERRR